MNHPPVPSPAEDTGQMPNGGRASAGAPSRASSSEVLSGEPSSLPPQARESARGAFPRTRAAVRAIRANRTGRLTLKVAIALVGAVIVAVGLILVPLPGPGWALVMLGLAVWAIEFAWARHLLGFTRRNVLAWTRWVGRQPWPIRLVIGLVVALFVGAVVVLSLRIGLGVDVLVEIKEYGSAR